MKPTTTYLDGNILFDKRKKPKDAVLKRTVYEEYFETPEYTKVRMKQEREYAAHRRQLYEDLKARHE